MTTAPDLTIPDRLAAAQAYLDRVAPDRPVEAALGRFLTGQGDAIAVRDALARYRNDDGGIGNGLEPDLAAPQSNPFAIRLALEAVREAGVPTDAPLVQGIVAFLERTQDEDGCWRWLPGTMDHPAAPWFQGWTFPALNPALDLAGVLRRLDLGSDRIHSRCRTLYGQLARREEITGGDFYTVLPYAESVPWLPDLPNRDDHLAALVEKVTRDLAADAYPAPQQAIEHIGPPDGPVARRLPAGYGDRLVEQTLATQQPDGSWPTPYDEHWRPYQTVTGMRILTHYPGH